MGSEFHLLFEMPNVMMFDMRVIYSLSPLLCYIMPVLLTYYNDRNIK